MRKNRNTSYQFKAFFKLKNSGITPCTSRTKFIELIPSGAVEPRSGSDKLTSYDSYGVNIEKLVKN